MKLIYFKDVSRPTRYKLMKTCVKHNKTNQMPAITEHGLRVIPVGVKPENSPVVFQELFQSIQMFVRPQRVH